MKQNLTTVETIDGKTYGPVRILFADKIRLEDTMRHNGWTLADNDARCTAFLSWAALTRLGLTDLKFDDWQATLADIDFQAGVEAESDPTPAAVPAS
ncbi:hypothetical protein [Schaalia sp. ZJ1691]|uniref:hypothetical protein n=1 Tax=Schaalia sp. ZJ1691 TaxID=2709404 RepID=UPI0013E9F4B9|nr:hypothetical protein [Schaalia sp. ZJ1691]